MSRIIGALVNFGLKKETSRGAGGTPTFWMPWTTFSFDDKASYVFSEEALGIIDESHEGKVTERWGEGDFEGELRIESFGLILLNLLGTDSAALVGSGVYDHTFSLSQSNQHQSLSLTVDDPNGDYLFPLAMIDSFELTCELNSFVKYKASFMSRPSDDYVVASPTHTVDNKFVCTNVTLKIADTVAGLGAASETKIQSFTLSIAKNLLRKMVLGTVEPYDIINQLFSVSGSVVLPYEDKTFKNLFTAGTAKAMLLDIEDPSVNLGGGYNPRLQITLPKVFFEDWTPNRAKGELYDQTVGFRAVRDQSNQYSSIYTVVLRNLTASY